MARFPIFVAVALTTPLAVFAAEAADNQPHPPVATDVEVKLEASDLDAITMDIVARYPILSASPGIKYAQGLQMYPSGVSARVIFFPHSESRGVKNAIQAHCRRESPGAPWSCPSVESRRYVELDTQDFEVRVVGDIDLDGVLALADATRALAMAALPNIRVDTLMVIYPMNGGFLVGWGSLSHREAVSVQATLKAGGNAANADDWSAFLLDENGDRAASRRSPQK